MEIKGLYSHYRVPSAQTAGKAGRTGGHFAAEMKDTAKMDTVDISPDAALKGKVAAASREYAARIERGVPAERIAALRVKYQKNACPVSGYEVADAILARVFDPTRIG